MLIQDKRPITLVIKVYNCLSSEEFPFSVNLFIQVSTLE